MWTTRYQSDPTVIGRTVLGQREPAVIVGVMPPGFEFPNNQKLWIPLEPVVVQGAARQPQSVAARLKPGVTIDRRAKTRAIAARLAAEYPDTNEDWACSVMTLRERSSRRTSRS